MQIQFQVQGQDWSKTLLAAATYELGHYFAEQQRKHIFNCFAPFCLTEIGRP